MTTTGIQNCGLFMYSCLPCLLVSAFDNVTDNHVVKLFLVEMLHDCTIKQIILIQSTATRSTFFISEIHDFYESTANRLKGPGYAYFSNENDNLERTHAGSSPCLIRLLESVPTRMRVITSKEPMPVPLLA